MALDLPVPDHIVIGSGKLFFNRLLDDGTYEGFIYLAETPGFTLNVTAENLTVDGSDGPIAERIRDIPIRIVRTSTFNCRDFSPENAALFLVGSTGSVAQSNTPVTDEAHTVNQGRFYQLGTSSTNPGGVRNVSAVTVTGAGGTPTYVAGDDYVVHAEMGMLQIVSGGGIANDTAILVDYTPATETRTRVTSHQQRPARGELKFVADNTDGPNQDVLIPHAVLAANGDLALKSREGPIEMPFTLNVQTRTGYAQVYIDGRAAV
ncbi:hypothetical protein AN401_07260 [Zobellella denitrificans]|uniref:Uncharacterized protein n=1 Tax=Zobellella denitrificans TaxID=347534 RepID=A0A291HNN7_9GAMM|nr:hypothetical protein [Zobellella denitrificans]ATG73681.1 hypothetical protein AN401_07260 [Zobellella denitrificans]